jgi:Arc/MetJ-type ribon-helix-helix transcriptional regulator
MSMKTVSLKLSDALEARLAALIRRRRTSKAAVVRAALEAYLMQEGTPAGASVLDVVQDLGGCVAGPVDLSTRRDALDGYGQ